MSVEKKLFENIKQKYNDQLDQVNPIMAWDNFEQVLNKEDSKRKKKKKIIFMVSFLFLFISSSIVMSKYWKSTSEEITSIDKIMMNEVKEKQELNNGKEIKEYNNKIQDIYTTSNLITQKPITKKQKTLPVTRMNTYEETKRVEPSRFELLGQEQNYSVELLQSIPVQSVHYSNKLKCSQVLPLIQSAKEKGIPKYSIGLMMGASQSIHRSIYNSQNTEWAVQFESFITKRTSSWIKLAYIRGEYSTQINSRDLRIQSINLRNSQGRLDHIQVGTNLIDLSMGMDYQYLIVGKWNLYGGFGLSQKWIISQETKHILNHMDEQQVVENINTDKLLWPIYTVFRTGINYQVSSKMNWNMNLQYERNLWTNQLASMNILGINSTLSYNF